MKTQHFLSIIVLLSACSQFIQAKESHQDTLVLKMPNNVLVEQLVYYRSPSDVKLFDNFKTYLEAFLEQFDKLETDELSEDHPIQIVFTNASNNHSNKEYNITVEDYKPKTKVTLVEKNSLLQIHQRIHLLKLKSPDKFNDFEAIIHFSTIDQLREIVNFDYEKINENLLSIYEGKENNYLKRKPFSSWINVNPNFETELIYNQIPNHPTDLIQLSAGTGLQSLKGEWLGSFDAKMTLIFSQKMVDKHAITIAYQWMYNFTSPTEKYVNDFIDFGYAYNFSSIPKKDRWAGINFGMLVNRKGEFFEKNTLRLGLYTNLSKSITVGPQMYFHGFFKNVYPGIKLNVTIL